MQATIMYGAGDVRVETVLDALRLVDQTHLLLLQLLRTPPGGQADPDLPGKNQNETQPDQEHRPEAVISRSVRLRGRLDMRFLVHR